ncbi:MAG: DNA-processing protein DprA [Synergistaceae bacterium]|jgi:DNA processing protein|nr:DNA-processing protein DprA [Synergistaceae bacterium]
MNDFLKAILLLNACRAPVSAWTVLKRREDPAALWRGGEEFLKTLELRESSCKQLTELLSERDWADREMERTDRFGARFLPIDDVEYPPRLKDLPAPPLGLYVKGDLNLSKSMIAIVGTRRCSSYGRLTAEAIGRGVAQAGYQVLSGGAKGIDGAGHRGCLGAGGTTIAVLGTALDRVYPAEHRPLFHRIAEQGALVSEYPMGTGGNAWRFPERNRIIAGLCRVLVAVESPVDGGAMITARQGLDIGREIWCVPGRITEESAKGTNTLIRDGANPLIDIDEFIGKISGQYGQLLISFPSPPPDNLSPDEKNVLELLRREGKLTHDDIILKSGLGFSEVQMSLATLCAFHLAVESGAGRYEAITPPEQPREFSPRII